MSRHSLATVEQRWASRRKEINMRRVISTIFLFFSVLASMVMPVATSAQTLIIRIAPPELPVYEQPAIPAYGYIWAPGYWAYGPEGYF
jgi:hypothetical protein